MGYTFYVTPISKNSEENLYNDLREEDCASVSERPWSEFIDIIYSLEEDEIITEDITDKMDPLIGPGRSFDSVFTEDEKITRKYTKQQIQIAAETILELENKLKGNYS